MKDRIVQEVRDARAALAADFDFDLHKFFAWAKVHTVAERKSKDWLPTNQNHQSSDVNEVAALTKAKRKGRSRPTDVTV